MQLKLRFKVFRKAAIQLLSPTLRAARCCKLLCKKNHQARRKVIIFLNQLYFYYSLFILALLLFFCRAKFPTELSLWILVPGCGVVIIAVSRINEIFIAFINDATSHLQKKRHFSTIQYFERIPLAMRSYVELIVQFAFLYYFIQKFFLLFNKDRTLFECVYFSAVTITTIGYGDISATHWMSQALCIYEILAGFALIIISFTVYVSRAVGKLQDGKRQ